MAQIVAKRTVEHLERSGFVVRGSVRSADMAAFTTVYEPATGEADRI